MFESIHVYIQYIFL